MKQAYTNTIRGNRGAMTIATRGNKGGGGKKKQLPKCTYGAACTRKGCVYLHPNQMNRNNKTATTDTCTVVTAQSTSNKICLPYLSHLCPYGRKCLNRHPSTEEADEVRKGYKLKRCLHGDNCRTEGCLYFHDWEQEEEEVEKGCERNDESLLCEGVQNMGWNQSAQEFIPQQYQPQQQHQQIYQPSMYQEYHPSMQYQPPQPEQQQEEQQQEEHVPTFEEWMSYGCPVPNRFYTSYQPDPWYTDDGIRKSYEQVYETLYPDSTPAFVPAAVAVAPAPAPAAPSGWAGIAAKKPSTASSTVRPSNTLTSSSTALSSKTKQKPILMPTEIWLTDTSNSDYFNLYPDPIERFQAVNKHHESILATRIIPTSVSQGGGKVTVLDVHFQSSKTAPIVLNQFLPSARRTYDEIWIITGSGHHVGTNTHQKKEERGVLFNVVQNYVENEGLEYRIGKDGQGKWGAILVFGYHKY